MDLSRIPAQPKPGLINVLIEIPAGSKNKYEFDKDMQAFALDRVLYSSVQYPYDYGFVPNTLADDGDPLDGMVLMDQHRTGSKKLPNSSEPTKIWKRK